jgi:hypothetical protein
LRVLAGDTQLTAQVRGGVWRAPLPAGTRTARLRSRVWIPAEMHAQETDTRPLGVAIGRLWLDGREVALDSPGLATGWHPPEGAFRWTDGDASLDAGGVGEIAFTVAMTGSYWGDPAAGRPARTRVAAQ